MTMTLTTIQTETTQDDRAKCDLFALATNAGNVTPYSNVFLVQDSPLNNSMNFGFGTRMQTPQLPASIVPVPTFAPTVIPVRPVPNVIQPSLVDQFPAAHQITSNIIQPVAIPSIPIQLQAETMHQNLLLLQQQRQLLQQQHAQQEVQQQLQQQLQQELQQVQTQFQHQQAEQRILPHQQVQQTQYQQQLLPVVTIPQHISATPQPIIHNLIPKHLQDASLQTNSTIENNNFVSAVNMLLTAATATNNSAAVAATSQIKSSLIPQQIQQQQQQPPAVSIPLTVQDRTSTVPPVFNGVNMAYPGLETLGVDPPIFLVRDFLTHAECDFLIRAADGVWQPAPVVGKGAGEISPSRTSSTCFLAREDLPDYLRKVSALTCKPIDHCELPQVGRYLPTQQYRHVRKKAFFILSRFVFGDHLQCGQLTNYQII